MTLNRPPAATLPQTLADDPKRVYWRIERQEPKCAMLSTETMDPNRACDLKLTDDPCVIKFMTLRQEPMRFVDRIESELPKLKKLRTDTAEPRRPVDRMLSEDPR
jgi:hypothetical protein